MTLLKELIEIPDHLDQSEFVIKLNEVLVDAETIVKDYVVTDDLQKRFAEALQYIGSSVQDGRSRACYLHGSFGSGKSHLMAILYLILMGDVHARGINELASCITKHRSWMDGKKFLLVPYHMIGSESSETGILGGYAKFIQKYHPDAPVPGVYRAEGLFQDAVRLKNRMEADRFFAGLNEGVSSGGGLGNITRQWNEERFENAIIQHHGEEERSLLISALSKTYFGSFGLQVENETKKFLDLEDGLAVICQHAKSIGYDAVILFLDELILWLSGRATNLDFVTKECNKLVKLVESANLNDRPIPLISFIARQRDLAELIGENVPGAEKMNFNSLLHHNDKRFHPIVLGDSNLPAIAERRVLECKSEMAKKELHASFDSFVNDNRNKRAIEALLTRDYTPDMFRQIYPFSPALIKTLIAISGLLQRERTALKVMKQLLVEQRDELQVGDLIPVGDLFDVVAYGEDAFNNEMKEHFENAKKLYNRKLLPELEKKHKLSLDQYKKLPVDDPARRRFRNDDRLAKTLLLSALVPDVEALRGLTAKRLAYLNHGTIKVVNAGEEGAMVLAKVREWARMIGEIKVGEGADPTITVQLSDVDVDAIIAKAESVDNTGNRQRIVRDMIFSAVGIKYEGDYEQFYDWQWKNTARSCIVLFKNIRELGPSSLQNDDERWKIIVDFPFDQLNHGPRDDRSKLDEFKRAHEDGTKTICWLPSFFSDEANADLGRLVRLDHILTGDRFDSFVGHLSPQDRPSARASLDSQRNVLRERVRVHVEAAFGLTNSSPESIHPTHRLALNEQFYSLANGLTLRPPTKPTFKEAMEQLLGQALEHEFPGAPDFEAEVKSGEIKRLFEYASAAIEAKDRRAEVDPRHRSMVRGIANPMQLGVMAHDATHFVIGDHWKNHIIRKHSASGDELTVDAIRSWIDEPKPMGLPTYVENMIVILFAEQTDHAFYRHGSLDDSVSLTNLQNCELRPEVRPPENEWKTAIDLAYHVFGSKVSELNNASNIAKLAQETKDTANKVVAEVTGYRKALVAAISTMGLDASTSKRLKTADACITLITKIQASSSNNDLIKNLAGADIPTTKEAMGMCCKQGGALCASLNENNFGLFTAIGKLGGEKREQANAVLKEVKTALTEDEHVKGLKSTIDAAVATSIRLLTPDPGPSPEPDPTEPDPIEPDPIDSLPPGVTIVERDSKQRIDVAEAELLIGQLKSKLEPNQTLRIDVTWVVEQEGE